MNNSLISSTIIVIIIIYIYYIQFSYGNYEKLFLEDLLKANTIKTGDIICFKAYNNFNSIFFGSYFGHLGIVYVGDDGVPKLFEANGVENMDLRPEHNKNGIFLSDLGPRIAKYKGRCFLKSLKYPVDSRKKAEFKKFIDFALDNMKYDMNIFRNSFRKLLNLERCTTNTNCGEIVFLSLLKLKLLPMKLYDAPSCHYLRWMSNITELDNNEYLQHIELINTPFREDI